MASTPSIFSPEPLADGIADALAFEALDLVIDAEFFRASHQLVAGDDVVDRAVGDIEEGDDPLALHRRR